MTLSGFYNMDCMVGMQYIPDKYFDLAIVDPPYGRKEHGGKNRSTNATQKNGTKSLVKDGNYEEQDWDNEPASIEFFIELFRVSKHQIIWGRNYYPISFGPGTIVWDKCNGGSDQSDCEIAYNSLTTRVDLFRYMWAGMMQGKSILQGHIMQGNKNLNEKRIHPTQKPIALYRWMAQKYAASGMKILDTHTGSASSLIAYEEAGIEYLAFERNTYTYQRANERLLLSRQQLKLELT